MIGKKFKESLNLDYWQRHQVKEWRCEFWWGHYWSFLYFLNYFCSPRERNREKLQIHKWYTFFKKKITVTEVKTIPFYSWILAFQSVAKLNQNVGKCLNPDIYSLFHSFVFGLQMVSSGCQQSQVWHLYSLQTNW